MDWRVWQALTRHLAPFFHLYAFDLRGHGDSDKPGHGYTVAHYAADIEDAIDQLGLTFSAVVGSSLGGMVAGALEVPLDLVTHRILLDPPLTGGPIKDEHMFRTILQLKHQPEESLAAFLAPYNPHAGSFLMRTMAQMWKQAADGVIEDMLEQPRAYNAIEPALRINESETLLVQADPAMGGVLTDREAQEALRVLPRGHLAKMLGAGHAVHAYKPRELTQMIVDFVRPQLLTSTR